MSHAFTALTPFPPCSSLGGVPGIPKVHFKGRQGEYYVMVGDAPVTGVYQKVSSDLLFLSS